MVLILVRLTERQSVWVRRAFDGHPGESIVDRFFAEAPHPGHSVDLTLPPDAWAWAARWLFANVYTLTGGRDSRAGSAGLKASRRVQTAVNRRARHPAFNDAGVLGTSTEVLTGWRGRRVVPFRLDEPHPSAQFVILLPRVQRWGGDGEKITSWEAFPPNEVSGCAEVLADESLHLPFGHEPAEV